MAPFVEMLRPHTSHGEVAARPRPVGPAGDGMATPDDGLVGGGDGAGVLGPPDGRGERGTPARGRPSLSGAGPPMPGAGGVPSDSAGTFTVRIRPAGVTALGASVGATRRGEDDPHAWARERCSPVGAAAAVSPSMGNAPADAPAAAAARPPAGAAADGAGAATAVAAASATTGVGGGGGGGASGQAGDAATGGGLALPFVDGGGSGGGTAAAAGAAAATRCGANDGAMPFMPLMSYSSGGSPSYASRSTPSADREDHPS